MQQTIPIDELNTGSKNPEIQRNTFRENTVKNSSEKYVRTTAKYTVVPYIVDLIHHN